MFIPLTIAPSESLTFSQMLRIVGVGQQECRGYGSWKPVLQALCSFSGKNSEQNQGYLHQHLSSVKVMLEEVWTFSLQMGSFLLYMKGC